MTVPPTTVPSLESIDDPWALDVEARRLLLQNSSHAQQAWLPRLRAMVEPPHPGEAFPAFLLETAALRQLRTAIGDATDRHALDTATADEVQRFVDLYFDYL